jgi:vacuolar-type H+-ATPase subunit E/Vma4
MKAKMRRKRIKSKKRNLKSHHQKDQEKLQKIREPTRAKLTLILNKVLKQIKIRYQSVIDHDLIFVTFNIFQNIHKKSFKIYHLR